MSYITGQTITEVFLSTDINNIPVVPAIISGITLQDGVEISGDSVSFSISLVDSDNGLYNLSFIPQEPGMYQVYIKNFSTNVIYMSDVYLVGTSSNIYVGI